MNKFEAMNQFNFRWNITLNNKDKFEILKNRVNGMLQKKLGDLVFSDDIDLEFIEIIGTSEIPVKNPLKAISTGIMWTKESEVLKRLMGCEKEIDYFGMIQILFLSEKITSESKEELYNNINDIIKISGYSNIVGVKKDERYGYIVYPQGERLLDKEVINKSLVVIEKYDTAYKILVKTLEKYSISENTGIENVEIIDNLRKVLENYLKEKFNSSKQSIDKILKEDVGKYLADKKIDVNIRNMYANLGNSIEKFSNEHTKHKQNLDITKQEVELFIYMVGTLVRFLESIDSLNMECTIDE